MKQPVFGRVLLFVLAASGLMWAVSGPTSALSPTLPHNSFAFAPSAHPHGHSQEVWSARWWTWNMELPVTDHPGTPTPNFDVSAGQSGKVWFLAAPFDDGSPESTQRSCTIPRGKSLFVALVNGEWSSLEGYLTEQEQRDAAVLQADHIVPSSLFCTLDGEALDDPSDYRFESPQFSFDAPTPWIFGPTGGPATAVADGYFVFLKKLHPGQHTLHVGGQVLYTFDADGFDFAGGINMTYTINQL